MERGDTRAPPPSYQSINETSPTAFNNMDAPGLDPDLIAQITENVIKQLRTTNLEGTTSQRPANQVQYQAPISPISQQSDSSPRMPSRDVYTPPSPHRHSDYMDFGDRIDHDSQHGSREYFDTVIHQSEDGRPQSRVSINSESSYARPKGPSRLSTEKEATTLEKIWGTLFDEGGASTARLGQFLRGLAVHLIEDYEPKNSIIVTPDKLIKYYNAVKLPNEIYPWDMIFDHQESNISRMYRELECEHHLVQNPQRLRERPDIPGLTPAGFEHWVTLLVQAHPEEEFERLRKTAVDMPISNPEDRKERFPKDISRRLFPRCEDQQIRSRIRKAIEDHTFIDLPPVPTSDGNDRPEAAKLETAKPRSSRHSRSETMSSAYSDAPYCKLTGERERKPYSSGGGGGGTVDDSAVEDEIDMATPRPIERERKPYYAGGGGSGQVYKEPDGRTMQPSPTLTGRSDSISSRKATAATEAHYDYRGGNGVSSRRRHSPSFSAGSGDGPRRSTDELRSYTAGGYDHRTGGALDSYDNDSRRRTGLEREVRRGGGDYARRDSPVRGTTISEANTRRESPTRQYQEEYYRDRRERERESRTSGR